MPTLHIYIRIIIDTTRPEPNPPRQNQRPRHHALTPTIADSAAKNNRAEQGEVQSEGPSEKRRAGRKVQRHRGRRWKRVEVGHARGP